MRIGTRMRTGRSGLATARFRSAIRVAVLWALALAPASQASPKSPGNTPSLVPEAEVLFWLALSAAASWLLTLHLRRRWRQHGMAARDLERHDSPAEIDDRPVESEPARRIEPENMQHTSGDPWHLDEAVGRLVAAANRLSAHADLIELTDRLNDLAERMEKPLSALELALAPRAERAETAGTAPETGTEPEVATRPVTETRREAETRPRAVNPAATRPAARFAFADSPATGDDAGDEFPESDDELLVGVEPRGLFELESARNFTEARVTRGARARSRPPARPLAGREALEITALGIGDSEALE